MASGSHVISPGLDFPHVTLTILTTMLLLSMMQQLVSLLDQSVCTFQQDVICGSCQFFFFLQSADINCQTSHKDDSGRFCHHILLQYKSTHKKQLLNFNLISPAVLDRLYYETADIVPRSKDDSVRFCHHNLLQYNQNLGLIKSVAAPEVGIWGEGTFKILKFLNFSHFRGSGAKAQSGEQSRLGKF
jgi:hypothetical protein